MNQANATGVQPHHAERFWGKVKKTRGCWIWTAFKTSRGYGSFEVGTSQAKRSARAHRVAWELAVGPIPPDKWVLHKCDTPSCVRPRHLFLGDLRANVDDMLKKRRQARGPRCASTKLTPGQVRTILRRGPGKQVDLAKEYGVTPQAIWRIQQRLNWRWVA